MLDLVQPKITATLRKEYNNLSKNKLKKSLKSVKAENPERVSPTYRVINKTILKMKLSGSLCPFVQSYKYNKIKELPNFKNTSLANL